jgi:AsmA protein
MTRLLKWVGIAVAGLLLLAVLAAVLLPSLVNLDRYRTLLAQRLGRMVGREVTLGALRFSLWQGIGAEATGVQVAQAPGFGAEPFLTAEAMRVRLQFLPLLQGQVKVASAVLERPRIRMMRAQDGRWGLDDLFKSPSTPPSTRPPAEGARPGKAPLLAGIVLSEVSIRNGEIVLMELGQPATVALTFADVDLTLHQENPTEPIDLRSRARLEGVASGRIEATGRIVPADKEGVSLDASILLRGVGFKALSAPGREGATLSGPISGEVRVTGPVVHPVFSGTLDLKAAALRIGEAFQKPAGEDALITFQGERDDPGVRFAKLVVVYRDTTVDGTLQIPDLKIPRVTFTASSPKVNLDRLMTPPKQAWTSPGVAWAAPREREEPKARGFSISAQGRLSIGDLHYRGLTWGAVTTEIRYQGGQLRLSEIQADFMKGRLEAKGEVDLRPKMPRISLSTRLEKVATEPLVKALAAGSWKLISDLTSESQVEFVGVTLPNILGSVSGGGSIQLGPGRLTDYRPLDRLAEVVTPMLEAQGVRVRLNEFEKLTGTYTLGGGILRTKDATLTNSEGTVTASGTLGLLDSSLDFDVVARLGRATVEAKLAGTTAKPIVIPKRARFQRMIEGEIDKALPGEKYQGVKDLLKRLFGR